MNSIIVTGNISKVDLKESKGNTYAKFFIRHHVRKAEGTYAVGYLHMTAFGKVAVRLSKFKPGSPLEFAAHFGFSQYEKNGKTLYSVDYIVDNFYVIGNGAFVSKLQGR